MRCRVVTILVVLLGLSAGTRLVLANPGLIFQSQSRRIESSRVRDDTSSQYIQLNPDLGPWSLHPTFPDSVILSHESTITSFLISDATDFDLEAVKHDPFSGLAEGYEEIHCVFTVDSPTAFVLTGSYAQQFAHIVPETEDAFGSVSLTGFEPVGAVGISNEVVPFTLSGVFLTGQEYHLDVKGSIGVLVDEHSLSRDTASYSLHWSLAVVPEPGSSLAVLGLAGLLLRRRRLLV